MRLPKTITSGSLRVCGYIPMVMPVAMLVLMLAPRTRRCSVDAVPVDLGVVVRSAYAEVFPW